MKPIAADSACDATRMRLVTAETLGPAAIDHLARCDDCRAIEGPLRRLSPGLDGSSVVEPPAELGERVLRAAQPYLAWNARRAAWRQLARALAVGLLPLPMIIAIDVYLVRTLYDLLNAALPGSLSLYLTANYVVMIATLLAVAYGAIPFLAERQLRTQQRELHV